VDVPVIYQHCVDVYETMLKDATKLDREDVEVQFALPEIEDDELLIWQGHLTSYLDERLGLGIPQYSRVVGTLREMQCIYQLRRGSGKATSVYILVGPPELKNYEYARERQGRVREKKYNRLEQEIAQIRQELLDLREKVERKIKVG
jgi:hypothetical protein